MSKSAAELPQRSLPPSAMDSSNPQALKAMVGRAALGHLSPGELIGVGTGSTVNEFIKALGESQELRKSLRGAVSSSSATTNLLESIGVKVMDANAVESLSVYVDGADEIDMQGCMLKGGGAALTREKIVASMAKRFICIADESKLVKTLGRFPLPVEIIPMASAGLIRQFKSIGGQASLRIKDEKPLVTDNGLYILDVRGLSISDPLALENKISQWAGVVTVGIFAHQKASLCLLCGPEGVRTLNFN